MAKRRALSVRVRFEVFKRDGFRCRYCGAGALDDPLEIDHVIPVSEDGTNDPANLVTACWACNSGKRDRGLDDSSLPSPIPAEALRAQADQIRAYLAVQREVLAARAEVHNFLFGRWEQWFGERPSNDWHRKIPSLLSRHSVDEIDRAMQATRGADGLHHSLARWRYFQAVLRGMRERAEAAQDGRQREGA